MDYQLAKSQFCGLSLERYTYRFRKHNDDVIITLCVIMTSFVIVELSNLHIFKNIISAIQPVSFNYLNEILKRG